MSMQNIISAASAEVIIDEITGGGMVVVADT